MAKDWKAEYDKVKGQMQEQQKQIDYYRNWIENRISKDDDIRLNLKNVLLEILGR